MLDQSEIVDPEEARPVDPYGGVALGVECAWPQSIPVAQATPQVTEEYATRDVVLKAGESFRLARRGLAIVEAFSDASISIR